MNDLNHDRTLASLFTEAKFAKNSRRWSRFGRNGETNGGAYARDARRAYNRAVRRESKLQLSRYGSTAPVIEHSPVFTWPHEEGCAWMDAMLSAEEVLFCELDNLYPTNI